MGKNGFWVYIVTRPTYPYDRLEIYIDCVIHNNKNCDAAHQEVNIPRRGLFWMLMACVWYWPSSFWRQTRCESAAVLKLAPNATTWSSLLFNTFISCNSHKLTLSWPWGSKCTLWRLQPATDMSTYWQQAVCHRHGIGHQWNSSYTAINSII